MLMVDVFYLCGGDLSIHVKVPTDTAVDRAPAAKYPNETASCQSKHRSHASSIAMALEVGSYIAREAISACLS